MKQLSESDCDTYECKREIIYKLFEKTEHLENNVVQ